MDQDQAAGRGRPTGIAPTRVQSWRFELERWCGDWTLRDLPWRAIAIVIAGLVAVTPIALSAIYDDLPPVLFAVPPMVMYVGIWMVFRQLDAPRPGSAPRPPRRRGPPRSPAPRPLTSGTPRAKARAARPTPIDIT